MLCKNSETLKIIGYTAQPRCSRPGTPLESSQSFSHTLRGLLVPYKMLPDLTGEHSMSDLIFTNLGTEKYPEVVSRAEQ